MSDQTHAAIEAEIHLREALHQLRQSRAADVDDEVVAEEIHAAIDSVLIAHGRVDRWGDSE